MKFADNLLKLIYRALIFERLLTPECPYHQPRAVNWRFQPHSQA
jgi:hypothetical protein